MTDIRPGLETSPPPAATDRLEELRDEFAAQWVAGDSPSLERMVDPFTGRERMEALRILLAVEIASLRQRGVVPQIENYRARFPDNSDLIAAVFRESGIDPNVTRSVDPEAITRALPGGAAAQPAAERFGNYELIREIARGGMGVVYEARPVGSERPVALKMILSGELATDDAVARFRREAEAAAQLDHPHIVPIYEIGVAEGRHYFTMAFVHGSTLAAELRKGPMDVRRATRIVEQIAEAVHYAHGRGVVHRDLKPGNVLLERDGTARVMDFGLAKRLDRGTPDDADFDVGPDSPTLPDNAAASPMRHADLTRTGTVMGTPAYMAPEQALESRAVGPSADIYSLGVILYALLTGRPPFLAANFNDLLMQILQSEPVPPREINRAVDPALEAVCLKCLRKDPKARYATAAELADDLKRHRSQLPVTAAGEASSAPVIAYLRQNPLLVPLAASLATYQLSSFFEAVFVFCLLLGMRVVPDAALPRRTRWIAPVVGFCVGMVAALLANASWEVWDWSSGRGGLLPSQMGMALSSRRANPIDGQPLNPSTGLTIATSPLVGASGGILGLIVAQGMMAFGVFGAGGEPARRLPWYGWLTLALLASLMLTPMLVGIPPGLQLSSVWVRKAVIWAWYVIPILMMLFVLFKIFTWMSEMQADGLFGMMFMLLIGTLIGIGLFGYGLWRNQPFAATGGQVVDTKPVEAAMRTTTAALGTAAEGLTALMGAIVVGLPAGILLASLLPQSRGGPLSASVLTAKLLVGAATALVLAEAAALMFLSEPSAASPGYRGGNAIEAASHITSWGWTEPALVSGWPPTLALAALIFVAIAGLGAVTARLVLATQPARRAVA